MSLPTPLILAILLAAVPAIAATSTLGPVSATPSSITVNTPTTVTVTIPIPAPTLISNGVNLLRLGATGMPTILGVMHDDGKNGDAVAGDHIYTLQVNFNEPSAGTVSFRFQRYSKGF